MQDRRSFVIGGAAASALVGVEASALAIAIGRNTKPSPAAWRITPERTEGVMNQRRRPPRQVFFAGDGRVLAFNAQRIWYDAKAGSVQHCVTICSEDRLIHFPAGVYWVMRDGKLIPWCPPTRCLSHPSASF